MPRILTLFALFALAAPASAAPPFHLWLEPEWFDGVQGNFAYWTGTAKPTGIWGIAGPGIGAEWTQGGESGWNSIGAVAEETKARCHRDVTIPRAGTYKVWVRFVDHRKKTEPFRVVLEQNSKSVLNAELGINPVLPANDEYMLYWGFSFAWTVVDAKLDAGTAKLSLVIDKPGDAWRQIDAILVTDDAKFIPQGREKPPFAYVAAMNLSPKEGTKWRGANDALALSAKRVPLGGRDFAMWTGIEPDPKWWTKQEVDKLKQYDVLFQFAPPSDIRDKFHKQFAGKKDVPIMSWPGLLPGFYLGSSPDLSPGSPVRTWLEKTKSPFYIMTNYAAGNYDAKTGPATYAALTGPLAGQFMGYIHGEALGTVGVHYPEGIFAKDRRAHVDALMTKLQEKQAEDWSKIYKTKVAKEHFDVGISCLSCDSIALAHQLRHAGAKVVGYEIDATNIHAPMRVAFERGAARQYGGPWINYASGNFGDACNYFSQQPVVPRGAPSWYHSKYAVTDGVSISWYRKLYYLNFLGGASAIYWEQSLNNQWILPGPGTHPIELSPFGRATEDFQGFVDRLPDRGEPYTPIAFLLSYGHSYERVNNHGRMMRVFLENKADLELRELFDVAWYPSGVVEGLPAAPDVQSMPCGAYGNLFDVLVDRPTKAKAIFDYPIVWAAGDVKLDDTWPATLKDYVTKGGTLVINTTAVTAGLRDTLKLGYRPTGKTIRAEEWAPAGEAAKEATPFDVAEVEVTGGDVLALASGKTPLITRHAVGKGAVIVTHVPHLVGVDERAHPSLPYLMNGLTAGLLPVEVRLADGSLPRGEIMYQVNKTKDGYLVALFNQKGIDKTQHGIARVDRRAFVDVVLKTQLPLASVRELTDPRALEVGREIRVRVPAGDLQVVYLTTK